MADVSSTDRFHRRGPLPQTQQTSRPISRTTAIVDREQLQEDREDEFYRHSSLLVDFDSLEPPSNSNSSFFILDEYNTCNDLPLDLNAEPENWGCEYSGLSPDGNLCFCGEDEYNDDLPLDLDADPANWGCRYSGSLADRNCCSCGEDEYYCNLFSSRETHVLDLDEPIWEPDSGLVQDTGMMEFGFGPGLRSNTAPAVRGLNLESDTGEFEVSSGFIINDEDDYASFGFNGHRNEREDFEWGEVNHRTQLIERENLDSVIHRIGTIFVSSNVPSPTRVESPFLAEDDYFEEERDAEWEVILRANNPDRNFEFEENNNGVEVASFDLLVDENMVENHNDNAVRLGLPASKSVVENLESIVLTVKDAVVCAVCKEDVGAGEKMTRMPCFHLFHGECLLPWLEMKNTCPVCRYELPTDGGAYYEWDDDGIDAW